MKIKKKNATIAEIAKASGTSSATVSRVLNHPELVNEKTLQTVHSAMEQLDYFFHPAAAEPEQEKLILINISEPANMFYSDIVKGISASASYHNYHVVLCHEALNNDLTVHYILGQLRKYRISGLILCVPTKPEYCRLLSEQLPVVQCAEFSSDSHSYVGIDNCKATNAALNHIYSLGCRKTLFVNGPLEYRYARERQEAFVTFMEKVGIPSSQYRITNIPRIDYDMAYASISQVFSSDDRPDSIFAASDVFAVAASKVAANYNVKVPNELVIVGFDNINLLSAVATPSITSVSQPRFQMGYTAGDILFESIAAKEQSGAPKHIILNTELIIRESSTLR